MESAALGGLAHLVNFSQSDTGPGILAAKKYSNAADPSNSGPNSEHAGFCAWGAVGHVEFYALCLPLWQGLTEDDIDGVFEVTDWLDGVPDVWEDIARRDEHSAVINLSPQFFADRLLRWGLGSAHGAGVYAGMVPDPALVLTPESKLEAPSS